jgi:hypothetical protein
VAKSNRTTVQVDLILAQSQQLHVRERNNGESLIDLERIDGALLDPCVLERLGNSERGSGGELGWVLSCVAPAKNLSNGLQAVLLNCLFRGENQSSGSIGKGRGIGGGDGTVLGLEGRAESARFGFIELCEVVSAEREES